MVDFFFLKTGNQTNCSHWNLWCGSNFHKGSGWGHGYQQRGFSLSSSSQLFSTNTPSIAIVLIPVLVLVYRNRWFLLSQTLLLKLSVPQNRLTHGPRYIHSSLVWHLNVIHALIITKCSLHLMSLSHVSDHNLCLKNRVVQSLEVEARLILLSMMAKLTSLARFVLFPYCFLQCSKK